MNETSRIDRRRAEQLLSGTGGARGTDPLARVLDAAAAPGSADELRGEDAARAAFLDAGREPDWEPAPHRSGRVLAAVVAGVALALVGVGAAAAAGKLPAPLQRPAHRIFHVPAPKTPGPQPTTPARTPPSGSSSHGSTSTGGSTSTNTPTTSGQSSSSTGPTSQSGSESSRSGDSTGTGGKSTGSHSSG